MTIPAKKCKHDNSWAVPGTDFCLKHGGKIPATIAEANARVPSSRLTEREIFDTIVDSHMYESEFGDPNPVIVGVDSLSKQILRERIETKIEEFREAIEATEKSDGLAVIQYDAGLIRGLELALQILEES